MKWYKDPAMVLTVVWILGPFILGFAGLIGPALLLGILCPIILILIG